MRRFLKILTVVVATIIAAILTILMWLYHSAVDNFEAPDVTVNTDDYRLTRVSDSLRICGDNWLFRNSDGLWEAKVAGSPAERGAILGLLSSDVLQYQERVFVDQIRRIIPSERYIRFLHKFIAIFNRNMPGYIPREYLEEIYAMSLSCSHEYDDYGTPYARQLNYHAAHDIGHTMQEYMLVGCSSFAAWGAASVDGELIVGRNFDFYVGDDFARNKVVLFVDPNEGYKFASVTWPGMMGVVSGMNECGLTVTINASKGAIPTSSAMPISLLVRHILQYADDIDHAMEIAQSCRTFVSESLLVASAADKRAVVIEKTLEETCLYAPETSKLVCTNHFQSEQLAGNSYNAENIASSDSPYRFDRLEELIAQNRPLDARKSVDILRNRYGLRGRDIGLTNEKSINQFIAHHAVVFEPEKRKMWVSTSPWQCGAFLCYDLDEIFSSVCGATAPKTASLAVAGERIEADTLFIRHEMERVVKFRRQSAQLRQAIDNASTLTSEFIEEYVLNNPEYYLTHELIGDYHLALGNADMARESWQTALTMEIPHRSTRDRIIKKIKRHDKK